jgi:hypothetical protein
MYGAVPQVIHMHDIAKFRAHDAVVFINDIKKIIANVLHSPHKWLEIINVGRS